MEWFSHGDDDRPTPLPWGRRTSITTDGELIHVARTDRLEVRSYSPDGTLVRIARSSQGPPLLDDASYDAIRRGWLETAAAGASGGTDAESRWDDLPRPEYAPEIADLRAGRGGVLWVELYRADGSAPRSWIVMDRGVPVAIVRMPASARVIDVGPGHVITRRTDELGVEFIDVFELTSFMR
jgi:hypothetical protein